MTKPKHLFDCITVIESSDMKVGAVRALNRAFAWPKSEAYPF